MPRAPSTVNQRAVIVALLWVVLIVVVVFYLFNKLAQKQQETL
jgi:flagellar biogenesis protein FliO